MRKVFVLVSLLLVGLLQVQASNDEELELYEEEEIILEGSGYSTTMPSDDEDINDESEESGSGFEGIVTQKIEGIDTTLTTTAGGEFYEDEDEIEPSEIPTKVRGAPPKEFEEKEEPEEETDPDEMEEDTDDMDVERELAAEESEKKEPVAGATPFMAAIIAAGCVGVLFAICITVLLVYRMRKKDEGSYTLEEQAKLASSSEFQHSQDQEFYA